ncbi:TonB-dependent receptor [Hyphococcus flavus]|uniref:TonB-dependent receptor n=1 Tax=Hyphococcus flavus TaxID=1866326 RepID=A0AAF0CB72_9PROT|nr:TonB-dependent receptor [Hyphococcus flavus]WDI30145.1 TonB-dependent receptor [Hyphococcus flavus]
MKKYLSGASLIAVSAVICTAANAQVDQIVVTATKRAENAQDIPVAVQALGAETLEENRVDNFTDYLVQLPGVTAGGSGPGQNTIYIRGLASTTPNLTTAGVAGLAPNVALYLDEQPLSQPGRNLDVYAVDLERVEVLPGPQGTLFGASSQAGTVRLITNKPRIGEFEASASSSIETTKGGEMSNKFEGMLNIPVGDSFALRVVGYIDDQGGYIDNVPGTRDASESGRFRPEGTPRANGVPVSAQRAGFQSTSDLSGVTFLEADNANLVEEDFNDTQYTGFRASALYQINDDWSVTVMHARQDLEADGVFFADPELDEYDIQRFEDDRLDDDFHNTSWTVEGRIGALEALYTGAYTDRDTNQRVDYSDYLFVGQYLPDYICDYEVVYPSGAPMGTCQPPNLYVDSVTETKVFTHELRFNTPRENRLRATVGAFYSDLELTERNDFTYPGALNIINSDGSTGIGALPPNFPLTNGAATAGQIGNESDGGYFSDPGPFPDEVIFRNDILRTDKQFGVFGEINYELVPNVLTLTFGTRYYDIEVDFEGSANSAFDRLFPTTDSNGQPVESQCCGTNISAQFAPGNPFGAPDTASTDGFIFKGNVSWTPTDDLLFYATYSEGFRPGLLNRPGGAAGPGGFTVPFAIDTDEVTNYEIGWKMQLFQNQLQLNGNAFYVDISRLQTTIFDPSITNLFFSDNAANAEIMGVEGDVVWAPVALEGLTLSGAFSVLDTEIKEVLTPTNDVLAGEELAFAPNFQGNIRARYEWDVSNNYRAHIQSQVVYSGSSFSDIIEINKAKNDAWATLSASAGIHADHWSLEVYGENLGSTYGVLANNFVYDRERVTVLRPRTIGVRLGLTY